MLTARAWRAAILPSPLHRENGSPMQARMKLENIPAVDFRELKIRTVQVHGRITAHEAVVEILPRRGKDRYVLRAQRFKPVPAPSAHFGRRRWGPPRRLWEVGNRPDIDNSRRRAGIGQVQVEVEKAAVGRNGYRRIDRRQGDGDRLGSSTGRDGDAVNPVLGSRPKSPPPVILMPMRMEFGVRAFVTLKSCHCGRCDTVVVLELPS